MKKLSTGMKNTRYAFVILLALVVDAIGIFVAAGEAGSGGVAMILGVPLLLALDIITAIVIWILLIRNWLMLPVVIFEALPGAQAFPFWTLFVLAYIFGFVGKEPKNSKRK